MDHNAQGDAKVQFSERLSPIRVVFRYLIDLAGQTGRQGEATMDNEPKRPAPEIMPPVPKTEPQRSEPEIPADKDAPVKDSPTKGES